MPSNKGLLSCLSFGGPRATHKSSVSPDGSCLIDTCTTEGIEVHHSALSINCTVSQVKLSCNASPTGADSFWQELHRICIPKLEYLRSPGCKPCMITGQNTFHIPQSEYKCRILKKLLCDEGMMDLDSSNLLVGPNIAFVHEHARKRLVLWIMDQ